MPADLVASIDRQSSHQRRRRLALLASLQAPHHNSPTNAAVGIEDWELRSNLTAYDACMWLWPNSWAPPWSRLTPVPHGHPICGAPWR